MNLSIQKRALLTLVPILALGFTISWVGQSRLTKSQGDLRKSNQLVETAQLARLYASEMSDAMKGRLLDPRNEGEVSRKKLADENLVKSLATMKEISPSPALTKLIAEMEALDEKELNPREDQVLDLIEKKGTAAGQAHYLNEYLPVRKLYDELTVKLVSTARTVTEQTEARINQDMSQTIMVILGSVLLSMVLVQVLLSRALSRDLNRISHAIAEGATSLTATSRDVSSISTKLSEASTEQASALQETAASIDEVSAMVAKTAENAEQSLRISSGSKASAEKGRVATNEMIQSIREIDQSNADIMQSIESSNREIAEIVKVISDIGSKTKVINDIVFQTKLLSFNASVEAARAGEHGKGFAVVAEEVGNLAQMSGNAAKEISTMLDSSIERVKSIVSATQQKVEKLIANGREKVQAGTTTAQRCEQVLSEMLESVESSNLMANEIATASKEQSVGIQEITKAMAQLDQVTQNNSRSATESARSSQGLLKESAVLRNAVNELLTIVHGEAGSATQSGDSAAPPSSPSHPSTPSASVIELRPRKAIPSSAWKNQPSADDPRFEEA